MRLARLENRNNFSVSSIEFLAVEKCDKQLDDDRRSFNDGRYVNPPAGGLRVSWESVNRVGSLDGNQFPMGEGRGGPPCGPPAT